MAGAGRQAAIGCRKWPPAPRPARGLLSGLACTALQQNRNTNTAERVPQQICDRLALQRGPCSSPRYVTCCTAGDVAVWLPAEPVSQTAARAGARLCPCTGTCTSPALATGTSVARDNTHTAHILFFFPTLCSLKIAKLEAGPCFPPVLFVK